MSASNIQPNVRGLGAHAEKRSGSGLDRFKTVRARSEALVEPLSAEDCMAQSMPDASPAKWHLAHTTWFFETFILENLTPGYQPFSPGYRVLFNSYYQGIGAQHPRPERGLLTRPSLDEVREYRAHVDHKIESLFGEGRIDGEAARLVEIGLHHEQQHQELLLTDLKHLLACNPLHPAYRDDLVEASATQVAPLRFETVPTGIRSIGCDPDCFHFDNEAPRHDVLVSHYALASRPVTNREYLGFLQEGAYAQPEWWLAEGWDVVKREGWRAPSYWVAEQAAQPASAAWKVFTLGGLRPLCLDAPVCHVSYYEADAYARWAGARLPTEQEWEVVAEREGLEGTFVEGDALHPLPPRRGEQRFSQLFGDVWEWTQSPYVAYPGFRVSEGALGEYNGKFMVNQLVLRGGSCVTAGSHIRASYRNFFPAAARWQFSGIRLARDVA
jgi:ergothioneine biosynthesis protein EgtB